MSFYQTPAVLPVACSDLVTICEAVFDNPVHPYTSGLLRCISVPGKTQPGEKLGTVPGVVPNLVGNLNGCMFRNRCEFATDECEELVERPTVLENGHKYTCRLKPKKIDAAPGGRL